MNIHEYQAKQLFEKFGVATPKGIVASTAEEAGKAAREIGGPVVGTALSLTTGSTVSAANVTVSGLPVIGFRSSVSRFTTGSPQNNYNDSVPLTLRRTVSVSAAP